MPTTLVHYFTGTGNTAHAVDLIAEKLRTAGHEVKLIKVSKDIIPPFGNFDFQIFAFPVLSWAAPVMMYRYLKKLPVSKGGKVAVLAINGATVVNGKPVQGFSGQALEAVEQLLKRKKYDVFLTGNASFPDNWAQMTNPCDEEASKIIFPVGDTSVLDFTAKFLSGKRELYRCGAFNKSWTYLIAGLFGKIGRRLLGIFYIADERCTGCGFCAKHCPAKTILMQHGRPRWKTNCEDCNRCINLCPEQAIQVSLPLMLIQCTLHILLIIFGIKLVLEYTPQIPDITPFLQVLLEIPLIILVLCLSLWICLIPLDAFFRLLQKIPAIRRFFCLSHTKRFRRYSAPGFRPRKG